MGERAAPALGPAVVASSCAGPTALFGLMMDRDALIERIRGPCRRDARRRRDRGGRAGARARRFAHGAQGARLQGDRGAPPGRAQPRGDARAHRARPHRLREAPADLDEEAGGRRGDRPHRPCPSRQAAARILGDVALRLPRPCGSRNGRRSATTTSSSSATTSRSSSRPERVRRICAPHFGAHSDGVLLLAPPSRRRASWRRCGSSTPTARRRSCPATGRARRSSTCAATAGPTRDEFSIETAAGEVRADDHLRARRAASRWAARGLQLARLSLGRRGRARHGARRRPRVRVPARQHRQPAVRDRRSATELEQLDLARIGPQIERSELFPNRTNVSFIRHRRSGDRVRARIFERGVGETLSSGTGASGAAVTAVLRGATSPVTVRARRRRAGGRGRPTSSTSRSPAGPSPSTGASSRTSSCDALEEAE